MGYAKNKICDNSVHPAFIRTMVENFGKDVQGFFEQLHALHTLGHIGEPIDTTYGILYLISR